MSKRFEKGTVEDRITPQTCLLLLLTVLVAIGAGAVGAEPDPPPDEKANPFDDLLEWVPLGHVAPLDFVVLLTAEGRSGPEAATFYEDGGFDVTDARSTYVRKASCARIATWRLDQSF